MTSYALFRLPAVSDNLYIFLSVPSTVQIAYILSPILTYKETSSAMPLFQGCIVVKGRHVLED